MAGNTSGSLLRITTAGESHGPGHIVVIDGLPPGLPLSPADLADDLARRRTGQSSIVSQRGEPDEPEFLSGVFEGHTTGTALAILIRNSDARSKDYEAIKDLYRPGHADFTFEAKYGVRDWRGGGRASARETVARVAAGAVAKKLLGALDISVLGWVVQVGDIKAEISEPDRVTLGEVEQNPVRCPDQDAAARMIALIEEVRSDRDSIGGIAEVRASGVPAGLGEPVFDKLRADLGKALLSLPAVLGVEFGAGFGVATARGSENNDPFVAESGQIRTRGNRHGGMLGGISSGMPIVMRCAVKPTSSLPRPQETVTRDGSPTTVKTLGRHDPCLLPRFVPMAEAMVALTLADHCLRQRAIKDFWPKA